jgi:hypothetical protein
MGDLAGLVVIFVALAALAASIAAGKGYSFSGFFVLGLFFWPVAMILALVLQSRSGLITVGSIIKVRSGVPLHDGGAIAAGTRAQVEGMKVIDGHPVVQVAHSDGSLRWIAKSNALPA